MAQIWKPADGSVQKTVVSPTGQVIGRNYKKSNLHKGDIGLTVRIDRHDADELTSAQKTAAVAIATQMVEPMMAELGVVKSDAMFEANEVVRVDDLIGLIVAEEERGFVLEYVDLQRKKYLRAFVPKNSLITSLGYHGREGLLRYMMIEFISGQNVSEFQEEIKELFDLYIQNGEKPSKEEAKTFVFRYCHWGNGVPSGSDYTNDLARRFVETMFSYAYFSEDEVDDYLRNYERLASLALNELHFRGILKAKQVLTFIGESDVVLSLPPQYMDCLETIADLQQVIFHDDLDMSLRMLALQKAYDLSIDGQEGWSELAKEFFARKWYERIDLSDKFELQQRLLKELDYPCKAVDLLYSGKFDSLPVIEHYFQHFYGQNPDNDKDFVEIMKNNNIDIPSNYIPQVLDSLSEADLLQACQSKNPLVAREAFSRVTDFGQVKLLVVMPCKPKHLCEMIVDRYKENQKQLVELFEILVLLDYRAYEVEMFVSRITAKRTLNKILKGDFHSEAKLYAASQHSEKVLREFVPTVFEDDRYVFVSLGDLELINKIVAVLDLEQKARFLFRPQLLSEQFNLALLQKTTNDELVAIVESMPEKEMLKKAEINNFGVKILLERLKDQPQIFDRFLTFDIEDVEYNVSLLLNKLNLCLIVEQYALVLAEVAKLCRLGVLNKRELLSEKYDVYITAIQRVAEKLDRKQQHELCMFFLKKYGHELDSYALAEILENLFHDKFDLSAILAIPVQLSQRLGGVIANLLKK